MITLISNISTRIDRVTGGIGRAASWLMPLLALTVVGNVILRYVFGIGSIELEELQWHMASVIYLLCFALAYRDDDHVRVNVISRLLSPKSQLILEILGCLLLLIPFCVVVGTYAFDFFWVSYINQESSNMPSGLPARYVIKFVLFFGLLLLGIQAFSRVLKISVDISRLK